MRNILLFSITFISVTLYAQDHLLPSRSAVDASLAPFYHGVASGDPLADRVILWTRVTSQNPTETVNWQISTDTLFANVVNSGSVVTDSSKDYTVKVDAMGLQENTWYYYRFSNNGTYSIMGRTRTNPSGAVSNLRFAVLSCSNLTSGYFNAYADIVNKNDVDGVIHLGDYYYEYGSNPPSFDTSRKVQPPAEILTLPDYRLRHSTYKLDPDLRNIHQQFPFFVEWDDHESANNSWHAGAENHTPGTEGNWEDRKSDSRQAYFEWMPIRDNYNSPDTIHRTIPFGSLADLIMIDTRLEGRDEQGGTNNNDPNRTILGPAQLDWFKQQLTASTAKWKIIGNQVMIAPLVVFGIGNADQWDGYPAERSKIYRHLSDNNINNFVVLTGDIHSSWASDLPHPDSTYNSSTGRGSIGTEFICTSVTSGGSPVNLTQSIISTFLPHIKYVDFTSRGYLLLDVTDQKVQGDWIYVNTITSKNFTSSVAASWCDLDAANHLTQCGSPLAPRATNPPVAPIISGVEDLANEMVMISLYPNPSVNEVDIQYYLFRPGEISITLTNLLGQTVFIRYIKHTEHGLFNANADLSNISAGTYVLSITAGNKIYSKRLVKAK